MMTRATLGDPGLAPHAPDGRGTGLRAELFDDLEAEAGVEGDVARLGRLEIGGPARLVDAHQHRAEERRAHPLSLPGRLGAQRGQVPVRLLGPEGVHLEQQPQGPVGVGADQKRCGRQQLEQLPQPVADGVGRAPQRGAVTGRRWCRRGRGEGTGGGAERRRRRAGPAAAGGRRRT